MLYYAVFEQQLTLQSVEDLCGSSVSILIKSVLRMASFSPKMGVSKSFHLSSQAQVENLRKMLVTMVDDVRVALIKLAERLCVARTLKNMGALERDHIAHELFDIYAPLAHRLGVGHIKWELEDLAFHYLQPENYKQVAQLLHEKRLDRDQYINDVVNSLAAELISTDIKADVSGRSKHIYSIWRKMQRKNLAFTQVYDVQAVRVLVPEIRDCYTALGIVHSIWRHIPKEFDDYIANPKENGYRSLHTVVVGPNNRVFEVQIRTHTMHEEAELGVCAHWRYKGTDVGTTTNHYEEKISWLRQVLEWHEELGDTIGLADSLSSDTESDRIYVFTPQGHAVDLAKNSTPLDFAYHVHTEVGHRCRGAKVNGRIVPLTYFLKTGEQIEIITGKQSAPSRDWLNSNLGYITSSRARSKIVHWFKLQDRDQNIVAGKSMLERELSRLALSGVDYNQLAVLANVKAAEDLFAALGAGNLRLVHTVHLAQQLIDPSWNDKQLELLANKTTLHKKTSKISSDVVIQGVGNLLTHMATCCKPLPSDSILGYITQGKGVSIHRQDCSSILHLSERDPARIIQVSWGNAPSSSYPVDILVRAYNRTGLLRDVTQVLLNEKTNVLAVSSSLNQSDNTFTLLATVEIPGMHSLGRLLGQILRLANVIEARRQITSTHTQ
ncbi:UNVERIFIED_CONTAM: hypothetical protein GTU68_008581 [Idotea baltica]|nr:hypothetical protein [Idotea baltica]